RTDGNHVAGTATQPGEPAYQFNRVAPLLVAPETATSYSAPLVAGVAASLIQAATDNPSFSNGSYLSPRTDQRIYHAATSETIKAAMLSGAVRTGLPLTYTVNSTNGLSTRMGAGEVNLYNSYQELAAGEQDAKERGNTHNLKRWGFDYE